MSVKDWVLKQLGADRYAGFIPMAEAIHAALNEASEKSWREHRQVTKAIVYVSDLGTFAVEVKTRRHPDAVRPKRRKKRK